MIITGIAHPPARLHERTRFPSLELVHFALLALQQYQGTRVITSLEPGWEQALAKAAIELELPYSVFGSLAERPPQLDKNSPPLLEELLAKADERIVLAEVDGSPRYTYWQNWRADQADLILALWDYDFQGETYQLIEYALKRGKPVANLWRDWDILVHVRRNRPLWYAPGRRGAQVFEPGK
jgi:hypothetical protein